MVTGRYPAADLLQAAMVNLLLDSFEAANVYRYIWLSAEASFHFTDRQGTIVTLTISVS